MYACTYNINIVKCMVSYCYSTVYILLFIHVLSYHNEIVFEIVHNTQLPFLMCIIQNVQANHIIIFFVAFIFVGLSLGLLINHAKIILVLQFQKGAEPQACFLNKCVSNDCKLPQKQVNKFILYTFILRLTFKLRIFDSKIQFYLHNLSTLNLIIM